MKKVYALFLALLMIFPSTSITAYAATTTPPITIHNLTTGYPQDVSYNQKYTDFADAYKDYVEGYTDDVFDPEDSLQFDDNDVACLKLHGQKNFSFSLDDDAGDDETIEIVHNTCIVLREATAHSIDQVKEVTVTVNTPIVVKSGHYLILRSQGMGYSNEYTTVKLNCPITVEEGATLLLDGPNIGGYPTGPRDIYVGPESGPAIIAEEGSTVRLGGVILQPDEDNEDAFIQAEGATVIVQAGNTKDTAKGTNATGALPDIDETSYHSNTYAETSGSAPIIEASEGTTVQLLGGNLVSKGDTPAITVDDSSSIKIDMENAAWTNKHGQGVEAEGEGTSAVSIASGGTLELGEYAPATASDNETQAIDLAGGSTVKKGDIEITVSEENDEAGDNYVDNYGNIILAKGATKASDDDEEKETLNAAVILADGTIIEGSEDEAPTVETTTNEDGTTTTNVTVPAGGSVTTADGDTKTWGKGGSVESNGNTTTTTPAVSGVTLSAETLNLVYDGDNKTGTLTAILAPEGATGTVSWSSSDESVATVSDGTVTAVGVGTATIKATVTDSEGNELASATCSVTVSKQPAPVVPTYAVTTPDVDNGTIAVSPKYAVGGRMVTITVTPDEGYELDTLTVTDAKGNELAMTTLGDGKYSFKMPYSKVTVNATFVETAPEPVLDPVEDCPKDETCPAAKFEDVKLNEWYHDGIHYCIVEGLMNGTSATTFEPDSATDRAMLVTVLYRLEGQPEAGDCPFTDVRAGEWYTDAITWAAENKIVEGYGDGLFGPEDSITREQFATILYRYAKYKGYDVSAKADITTFVDGSDTEAWAEDAMAWAVAEKLINGIENNQLDPQGDAIRAQMATILYRFCENVAN